MLVGVGGLALFASLLMQAASALNLWFGATVTLAITAFLLLFLRGLNRWLTRKSVIHPFPIVLSSFALVTLLAATVCAWFSYILYKQGWATYSLTSSEPSVGKFVDYYVWTFFDMLPGLEIWKSLQVPVPVEPKDLLAGVPVLAFRLLVVLGVIRGFVQWNSARKTTADLGVEQPSRGKG